MNPVPRLRQNLLHAFIMALVAMFLTACGGGSDSSPTPPNAVPASITAQPSEQAVVAGETATFNVVATGDGLSYQWQRSADAGASWVDIAGATAASVTVATADPAVNGTQYRVIISGVGNPVTSSAVTLTVAAAPMLPVIVVDAVATTVSEGADAVFSVTATGTSLSYQWQTSPDGATFTDLAGATDATLRLPGVTAADTGKLVRVVVSSGTTQAVGSAVALTVTPATAAVTIVTQPLDVSVTAPAQATFVVSATGSPTPAYQWQISTNGGQNFTDITGATAATYTTPATMISNSGSRFSVKVSNPGATVVSRAAILTVAQADVAPLIATQPVSVTVGAGAQATFTVVTSGTPTPTLQWQVSADAGATFANITGATSTTYTTAATVSADNTKQFRVVVSNRAGLVTSTAATLTVQAASGGLLGRSWTSGQLLESNDDPVRNARLAIDDAGRSMTVFVKQSGNRYALMASRGMPNAVGVAPTWSPPVAIDLIDGAPASGFSSPDVASFELGMSPSGNAVVYFAGGTELTNALYAARFTAATGQWEQPVLVGTAYTSSAGRALINDRGDVAIQINVQVASGSRVGVFSRPTGESSFQLNIFDDARVFLPVLAMDGAGQMLVATNLVSGSVSHIAVSRGAVAGSFGEFSVVDTVSATASLNYLAVGVGGQQIVVWSQNNGSTATMFAAAATGPTQPFSVIDLGRPTGTGVVVSAAGQGTFIDARGGQRRRWVNGAWLATEALPITANSSETCWLASSGDMLCINTVGAWFTYEAARNVVVQPRSTTTSAGYVLGVSFGTPPTRQVAFSAGGNAVEGLLIRYDALPSASLPAGVTGDSDNYWGIYLK